MERSKVSCSFCKTLPPIINTNKKVNLDYLGYLTSSHIKMHFYYLYKYFKHKSFHIYTYLLIQ